MANSTKASKAKKKATKKTTKKVSKKASKKPKATAAQKTASKRKPARKVIDATTRQQMIEERAYFNAQQRNFVPGNAMDDWLLAESEVDKMINKQ